MNGESKQQVSIEVAQRRKLFLGGLPNHLVSDDLIQLFRKYGTLEDAVVMRHIDSGRSKGFGFLTFSTLLEAEACLRDSPHVLDGKTIDMKRATPRENLSAIQDQEEPRKLFLGHLSYGLEKKDIVQYFQKYGTLEDAVIMRFPETGRSKGFGFVTFSNLEETERCLQDGPHTLDGQAIDIKKATPRGSMHVSHDENHLQNRKLFVGNVPYETTTEKLKEFFSKFGEIDDCVVMRDVKTGEHRGFGFVTYSSLEEVDECQNNRPHVLDGRKLDTKRATAKNEKPMNENAIRRLFVGGLAGNDQITDEDLREYFSKFGLILGIEFEKYKDSSKENGKKRNFAFIEFEDYDSVDKASMSSHYHIINGWRVHASKALPKVSDRIWERNGLESGDYSSPWSARIASGLEDRYDISGIGLHDRSIPSGMYRSNVDSNMFSMSVEELLRSRIIEENLRRKLIEEKLRESMLGGFGRSHRMDATSRNSGIGRLGGFGPVRNQMRGGVKRGPY